MKSRRVVLASGERFTVPQGIQRLDSRSTRGWQVRYQGTKYFADGDAGPRKSLLAATRELLRRIATLPAPVVIKREPSPRKTSDLPAGISGPLLVSKSGSDVQSAVLAVLLPRFGRTNEVKKIHIGTSNTYTRARYRAALAKAVALRNEGVAQYEADATRARRKEATALRKTMVAAARVGDRPRSKGSRA
jgi:hypothetical protein